MRSFETSRFPYGARIRNRTPESGRIRIAGIARREGSCGTLKSADSRMARGFGTGRLKAAGSELPALRAGREAAEL